jgi:hypothetical protein
MLIYISGPYSEGHGRSIDDNIAAARKVAVELWEDGHTVICPHLNTAHFEIDCKLAWKDYLDGDLEIIDACQAVVFLPNWEQSTGACMEYGYARRNHNDIYIWPDKPKPERR